MHTGLNVWVSYIGANPANVSVRPKHVRVLIVHTYRCMFRNSEKTLHLILPASLSNIFNAILYGN